MALTKTFLLDEDDVAVIDRKSREMGDASASATLRVIIREWDALQRTPPPLAARPTSDPRFQPIPTAG